MIHWRLSVSYTHTLVLPLFTWWSFHQLGCRWGFTFLTFCLLYRWGGTVVFSGLVSLDYSPIPAAGYQSCHGPYAESLIYVWFCVVRFIFILTGSGINHLHVLHFPDDTWLLRGGSGGPSQPLVPLSGVKALVVCSHADKKSVVSSMGSILRFAFKRDGGIAVGEKGINKYLMTLYVVFVCLLFCIFSSALAMITYVIWSTWNQYTQVQIFICFLLFFFYPFIPDGLVAVWSY